jgi:antitoxin component of MazEF toxin-antitoxin module
MEAKDVGRIYIGRDGEGRLYIPKSLMKKLSFEHGEKVKLTFRDGVLTVEKL